jgi:hypothetical protein
MKKNWDKKYPELHIHQGNTLGVDVNRGKDVAVNNGGSVSLNTVA